MPIGKRQGAASGSGSGSTGRVVKRRKQENSKRKGGFEAQEAGLRDAANVVKAQKTATNMKNGSFPGPRDTSMASLLKRQWKGSTTTRRRRSKRLKLRARKTEAEFRAMEYKFRAMHQELNKVFKDHQRVWKRLLKAPHCFSMSNPRWHPQGHESDSNDDDDSAPISDVDDNAVDPASEAPLRPRK